MFARLNGGLPPDAPFKPDLKELGYFIKENGDVRSLKDPSKSFHYYINKVPRWNDVNREAMDTCMRAELLRRCFESEDLVQFYLPQMTTTKPTEPHVPILTTPLDLLRSKRRVLVILNEPLQDLGVWAWRVVADEGGMVFGTALGLARELKKCKDEAPGLIVANPGQLLYSHKYARAVTYTSWDSMPRKSGVHPRPRIHPQHNLIPGNKTPEEHARFVLDNVVFNPDLVAKDAEIYVVGLGIGANEVIQLFNAKWSQYSSRVTALGFTSPSVLPDGVTDLDFKSFLAQRARSWVSSAAPLNACIAVPGKNTSEATDASATEAGLDSYNHEQPWGDHGPPKEPNLCPTFSCAKETVNESIFPLVFPNIVDWFFNEVAPDSKTYKNPELELFEFPEDESTNDGHGEANMMAENGDGPSATGNGPSVTGDGAAAEDLSERLMRQATVGEGTDAEARQEGSS